MVMVRGALYSSSNKFIQKHGHFGRDNPIVQTLSGSYLGEERGFDRAEAASLLSFRSRRRSRRT
jgi:hypothetical protein